jgi:hypothetical protein
MDTRFPGGAAIDGFANTASASGNPLANGGRLARGMPAGAGALVRFPMPNMDGLWLRRGSGVRVLEPVKLFACRMARGMSSSSSSLLALLAKGVAEPDG